MAQTVRYLRWLTQKNNLEVGSLDAIYWDPPDQLNFTIGPILGLLCMSHLRHPCAYRTS